MRKILKNNFCLIILLLAIGSLFTVSYAADAPKQNSVKLPHSIFFKLIDTSNRFVINHQVEFKHIDVPLKYFNTFNNYIKDSTVTPINGLKSLLYYHYSTKNGEIFNGDIYWNEKNSYIIFTINGKQYINYFSRDGVQQLKSIFKL